MALGQPLDIDAVYATPQGQGPRLVRAEVGNAGSPVTLTPRPINPDLIGPTLAGSPATQALLWTYVRVNGPVEVTDLAVSELELPCGGSLDAGVPDVFHRAVLTRVDGTSDLAVAMRRGDPMAAFCLFECEQTCNAELMVGDTFGFVQGVVDVFAPPGGGPHVILNPVRNTDVGKP
jgi:hypothetical protein